MMIACRMQCRVIELNNKKAKPFEIKSYDAHHYNDKKLYKVEYRLVVVRVSVYQHSEGTNFTDAETLKENEWFMKEGIDKTHFINFADTQFAYNEKHDRIVIERDFDEV